MIQQQKVSIPEMVEQSMAVLQKPNEGTFERYEKRGTLKHAALYVALAAAIVGLFGVFSGGVMGIVSGIVGTLVSFFLFTGLVYAIGKRQGGTGTFDEVTYSFALFAAPLSLLNIPIMLLGAIPLLGPLVGLGLSLVLLLAWGFFGYIAVRASMNIYKQQHALMTLGGAILGTFMIQLVLSIIF